MGKKKDEDLELDLAGVNGLRNSDYTFTLSIMLLSMRVAVILLGVLIYFRPVIFFRMNIKGAISCRWCTWDLTITLFFLCVQLAGDLD